MTIGKMKQLMGEGNLQAINAWLMESVACNHTKPEGSAAIASVPKNISRQAR